MGGTTQQIKRPLLIAISGGAGCISSIEALAAGMRAQGMDVPLHTPILPQDKKEDRQSRLIRIVSSMMNAPGINSVVAAAHIPAMPNSTLLEEELSLIIAGQKKPRYYIDLLLDVIDSGYLIAAMYNFIAKKSDIEQSREVVNQQAFFENWHFNQVKAYFLKKLRAAKAAGTPYTEIVTTQMVCIDSICAAILAYNAEVAEEERIHLHQYMSDVFTSQAQHYLWSLNRLGKDARSILHLHGMNIKNTAATLLDTQTKGEFASIEEIDYANNPMVRQGFKRDDLEQYRIGTTEAQSIPVQNEQNTGEDLIEIQPGEKVAAIMLSSVGSESTVNYTELLSQLHTAENADFDKVFVFCSKNKMLKERLAKEIERTQGREAFLGIKKPCQIIILGIQSDAHVANIFTRSNLSISRGGFLLMEQMAKKNHHPEQRYFFPHIKDKQGNLTTGLPWEDASIQHFIGHLQQEYGINWAKKGEVDDLRFALKPQWRATDALRSYQRELKGASKELNDAFSDLLNELIADLEKQYQSNSPVEQISKSTSYQLAMETMKFIDNLAYLTLVDTSTPTEKQTKLIELVHAYDRTCYPLANYPKLTRYLGEVISTCIGFILGFAVGVAIGLWTGPGALVTGILGAAGGSTLAAGSFLASYSFFKPVLAEQKRQALASKLSFFTPVNNQALAPKTEEQSNNSLMSASA